MFYKLLFFLLLSLSLNAGDRKGNGGDVLTCDETSAYHLWSLDWYEMQYRYDLKARFPSHGDEIENALEIIERIKVISPRRYAKLSKWAKEFYAKTKFSKFPLSNVRDSGDYDIPEDCDLSQVVNQNQEILPKNKHYLIYEKLWNRLSVVTKTSLILHELIYKSQDFKTSENLRKYVAYLIADEFHNLDVNAYNRKLKSLGFSSNEVNGLSIDLKQAFHFSENGTLLSAYPVPYSSFSFSGKNFVLRPHKLKFYENASLASFCPDSSFKYLLGNQYLEVRCSFWAGDFQQIEYYPSGKLKAAIVEFDVLEQNGIKIFSPLLNQGVIQYTAVQFYENENIKELSYGGIMSVSDDHIYFTDRRSRVKFYENGNLKMARLDSGSSWNYSNGRLLVQGWAEFYDNFQIKEVINTMDFRFELQGRKLLFLSGYKIQFHSNGVLRTAILGEDANLKDIHGKIKSIKKSRRVFFNEEGLVY